MSILKELSKQDKKWRTIAYNICKDYDLAQDLVQEMYLKLMNRTRFNDYFVAITLRNLFLDTLKKRKNVRLEELHYIQDQTNTFEPTDEQQAVLDEFDKLDWVAQELLLERIDKSLRQIQETFNINYGYAYRETTKAKEQIKNNVKKNKK